MLHGRPPVRTERVAEADAKERGSVSLGLKRNVLTIVSYKARPRIKFMVNAKATLRKYEPGNALTSDERTNSALNIYTKTTTYSGTTRRRLVELHTHGMAFLSIFLHVRLSNKKNPSSAWRGSVPARKYRQKRVQVLRHDTTTSSRNPHVFDTR